MLSSKHKIFLFLPVALAGAGADLWSKAFIFEWLLSKGNETVTVIPGVLSLVMRVNTGAAFSIATGQRGLLIGASVCALLIVVWFVVFGQLRQKTATAALGMFAGGVLGNLYDRIFNEGGVRDFIDVYYHNWHWPAFNVADSLLCIAVLLLIISTFTVSSGRARQNTCSADESSF
ncbi:MAG: signal peptidase II [Planctomycetota bacterium]